MKRTIRCLGIILALLASGTLSRAHDETPQVKPAHPEHKSSIDAAQQATDPSAILAQLGFFYWTSVDENRVSDGETFLFQPVLPLSKTNVFRPALPVVSTPSPGRKSGIGDLFLLDAFFFQVPKGTWGIGPVASIPTASHDELGTGKWTVGFDFLYMYKGFKKDLWGFLFYPQWSIAGSDNRADVNNLTYQFIYVHHFKWGYIGWTDQTGTIDFENDDRVSFPLGIRFGTVMKGKTLWNLTVQPYYTLEQGRDDVYGIKLSATAIKPNWMQH